MSEPECTAFKLQHYYIIDRNQIEFDRRNIPKERFVEYEPKDLDWMIPLGMAPEIEIPQALMDLAAAKVRDRLERLCMIPAWMMSDSRHSYSSFI